MLPALLIMRLTFMTRTKSLLAAALFFAPSLMAQFGGPAPTQYKDTSMLKPPAGYRVAIWKFEDLECPLCAHDWPIVHDAIAKYKIGFVRHDFPLKMHFWSHDAAVDARYIQDKVPDGARLAEEYRGAVFAAQVTLANKDDLRNFTMKWAKNHGILWPFIVDPQGKLTAEVDADYALGLRIGVQHTPTIWVVNNHGAIEVTDINQLYAIIDEAIASAGPAPKATSAKK